MNIFPSILTKLYLKFAIPKPVRTTPFRLPRNFSDENKKIPSSCNPEDEIYLVVPPRFAISSQIQPYQVRAFNLYFSAITGTPVAAYCHFGAQLSECIHLTLPIASQQTATLSRLQIRLLVSGHRLCDY